MSKFELYKDHQGGFRWQLKSTEGRTIAVSAEAHKTMAEVRESIATVKREAAAPISTTNGDDLLTRGMRWKSALNAQDPHQERDNCGYVCEIS